MSDKEKGLFEAFVAGKLSRRELLATSAKLGISAAAGGMLLTQAQIARHGRGFRLDGA